VFPNSVEVQLKLKLFACALLVAATAAGCHKSTAPQTTTASAAAAQPAAAPGQPPAPAKPVPAVFPAVVARVNGEDVKKADFERMIHTIEGRAGQPIPADHRNEILRGALDQLVVYTLLAQESKTRGIKVDDAEVNQKMQELRGQFPTADAFNKALKDRGMTEDSLRHDALVDLTVTKLMDAEVATTPGPSDAEIKDFYDKNPDKFKQEEQVRASHILIRVDQNADAATKAKAKTQIESILKQARAGADFAGLAKKYSQDGSAQQGGDLNYFSRGQMVPQFDAVAFKLKTGQISDVVQTEFGYHIIKVTDHKAGRTVPFEEAKPQITQYLTGQRKQQHADAFIDTLKKKSKIDILI
jgi:peptidyl-prolyl cis-trans isomerase C